MATVDACRAALERLADKLQTSDGNPAGSFDRTLSCRIPDLAVTFVGRLQDGRLHGITTVSAPRAQIRLTADSDDLVALMAGELSFGQAWLGGKIKVDAGVRDLLKLRSML